MRSDMHHYFYTILLDPCLLTSVRNDIFVFRIDKKRIITTSRSPLNKCPDAYININEVGQRKKLFITVDGQPVTNVLKLDSCHILEGERGISWGRKDQFELRFRINAPGTQRVLKISSIIVF
jgi:hypothetical protein